MFQLKLQKNRLLAGILQETNDITEEISQNIQPVQGSNPAQYESIFFAACESPKSIRFIATQEKTTSTL